MSQIDGNFFPLKTHVSHTVPRKKAEKENSERRRFAFYPGMFSFSEQEQTLFKRSWIGNGFSKVLVIWQVKKVGGVRILKIKSRNWPARSAQFKKFV